MSTNLQNLQNMLSKPGTASSGAASGASGASLSDLLGGGKGSGDSQSFAKLMAQYQSPQAIARNVMPSAATSQPHAASEALRAKTATQAMAQPSPQQAPHAPEQAKQNAESQQSEQSQQASKQQAQKSNAQANKSGNDARAKAKQADGDKHAAKADKAGKPDAKGDAKGDEVKFTTAQGDGAAQVRELQPPPDVPTSDPAAMMAWLASLSQSSEGATAAQGESALTEGGAGSGTSGTPGLLGAHGKGGAQGPDALPTGTAALTTQLMDHQAGKADAKAALATEVLGTGATAAIAAKEGGSSPLEFNALMAREMSRPAGASGPGAEATVHATATLQTPVDSPDFKQALAERVGMWVHGAPADGQMTAELRLNPEDMGPVHIRIVMDGQNAQVDFAAAHAETRQALEASLPALSTALQDAGLNLSGGGVSDQNASQAWAQQQQGQGDGQPRSMAWSGRGLGAEQHVSDDMAGMPPVARPSARPGGLDLYA